MRYVSLSDSSEGQRDSFSPCREKYVPRHDLNRRSVWLQTQTPWLGRGVAEPAPRFPPLWTVEQIPGGYKVLDANGQSLAYVYGRETKADADIAATLPT